MSESKSASVVFTNSSLLAKNAQLTADSAKTAAEVAQNQAITAQKTADGKNSVYRGSDPSTVPTAGLKEGDLYFTDNALYTWNGSAWEETVSDTTGAEIKAKVEAVMQESQKEAADLRSNIESKAKELDSSIQSAQSSLTAATNAVASDLSATKSDLSATKSSLNSVASDLSTTKSNLADTGNRLEKTISEFQQQTGQLSGSLSTANSKIEFNSKAIAEVKRTADEISTTVSNIRVGGRNLLTNTRTLSDVWTGDTETVDGFTVAKATKSGGDYYDLFQWHNLTLKPNTDYVLTFYAKASKQTQINSYLYDIGAENAYNDGSTPNTLTTDYQRITVHFHTDAIPAGRTVNCLPVRLFENGVTAWIYGVQLEEGNTATQWQPNPDDTDQAISKVSQTADAIKADLANTKGDVASVKATANSLTSDMKDAKGNISQLQQTASGLTSRVGNAEGNISQLQQDTSGLKSTVSDQSGKISQLQQTASGLTSTVSNMKSGGANMLPAGGLISYYSSTVTYDAITDTYTVVNPASTDASWGSGVALPNACIEIPWRQTVCVSMEVYTPTAGTIVVDINNTGDGVVAGNDNDNRDKATFHNMDVPANEWTTVWFTYENSDSTKNPKMASLWDCQSGIGLKLNGVTWKVRHPMVQLGTLPSGWSPSPKDTDSAISQIKQTADGITAYVKKSTGSSILASMLSMDPNNSSIAQLVNNKPVAAINLSKEGNVQIDGSHISLNSATTIPDATIKSSMIESLDASKITAGVLDASRIKVINLDAGSITTGSLSAVVSDLSSFKTYVVSASNTWNFNDTKSAHENWFLVGETTADHVYNGPCYNNNPSTPLTPCMYVTSRGVPGSDRYTVTVWKDNDPTQYQRSWDGSKWTPWVMLPNSQNLVSTINLSPDSVKISGKNIELDGNTKIADGFVLSADKIVSGTLNGMTITGSRFIANTDNGNLFGTLWKNYQVVVENTGLNIHGKTSPNNDDVEAILTSDGLYLQMVTEDNKHTGSIDINNVGGVPYIKLINSGPGAGQYASTYIGSDTISSNDAQFGNWHFSGTKVLAQNGSLYVANSNGTNFDNSGSVGFQVWSGIGLGRNTLYMPSTDLYIQMGNCGPGLGASYSSSSKVNVHCNSIISQVGNTVSSRLSVKTDITPVSYDRALAAVEGTDMYDYRYVADDSGQHYVSGIIDDVNADPQYHMDGMLINKERTARIDANLIGYHHVVLQELLKKIDELEIKLKSLESKEK